MAYQKLSPNKLLGSLRRRGVKGFVHHMRRRIGMIREQAMVGPDLIRINPMGFVCNHTCPMCWLQHLEPEVLKTMKKEDREKGMKLADYQALFNAMPPGLREVNVVGGGEPLVHPEAVEIFAEIRKHGWRGSLISNCTLLKESIARRLIEMRWTSVRASVHAGDAETYRAIQGVDRFDTMRENLKAFTRLRREAGAEKECRLAIFHVIQRDNIPTMHKLFEIAEDIGADFIEFDPIIPYDAQKWLTAEEIRQAHDSLKSCSKASRIPCNAWKILPELRHEEVCATEQKPFVPGKGCTVGYDQAFIAANGDVTPCCFSSEIIGNVREKPFNEIWYGAKFHAFRNRLLKGKFAAYCIENRCTLPDVIIH